MSILHNLGGNSLSSKNIITEQILSSAPMNTVVSAGTFAQGVYLGILFTADFVGVAGNSIQVVYDGIITSAVGTSNWNTGPGVGNTTTMDDTGYTHPLGSVTLTGGTDDVHDFVTVGAETITADIPGASGITLNGDGVIDWVNIINTHNLTFPGNTVTLTAGNILNVPALAAYPLAGNGPGTIASGTYDGVTYTADNNGLAGNITLNFNGTTDSRNSVVAFHNSGNPSNTIAITAEVITPLAGTATLSGGIAAGATGIVTATRDTDDWVMHSLDVSWTGGTALDGTMWIEVSNGGISWTPLQGIDGIKIQTDAGNEFLDVSYINFKYWRFVYTANSGADGFMTAVLNVRA